MKKTLILWCLMLVSSWAQELTISHLPYLGRILLAGKNEIYVSLKELATTMNMAVIKCKHGFWAGYQPPEELPGLEFNQVQVGETIISSVMLSETREYFVSAEKFCQGVGAKVTRAEDGSLAVTRPLRPKSRYLPAKEIKLTVDGRFPQRNIKLGPDVKLPPRPPSWKSESFFLTQYKSGYNQDARVINANCGPTTLAMVALAYNTLPPAIRADNPQGIILWCREQMTGNSLDEDAGTCLGDMRRVGTQLGLQACWVDDLNQLDWELLKGRLVAIAGDIHSIGRKGVYDGGGHAMLVVSREGGNYIINDPGGFFRLPGSKIKVEDMQKFFRLGLCFWREKNNLK